ncbi:MAG TPA: hypothetical protein EYQ50_26375 [Verrucomicrobiales bacterium]|nr:hypothetical protein [Verrucomicrobiales bacterium]
MPDFNLQLQEAADLAAYLLEMTEAAVSLTLHKPPLVKPVGNGKAMFNSLGCAHCHSRPGEESRQTTLNSFAPPLAALVDKVGGCLSPEPKEGIPHFFLDSFQRRALLAALQNLPSAKPIAPAESIHREMVRLNCLNCHQRNGEGGPGPQRLKYFVSSGSDLGDEGRVPPTLTGVGRKMRLEAMKQTIQGHLQSRPYMLTRMPGFGEVHASNMSSLFAEVDAHSEETPTPRNGQENMVGRNMWGRALIGTKGLSCITCHRLKGKKSLGIPAMDLSLAPRRLRPQWFRDYLIDPAHFRSGTRMPSFWPEGVPSLKGYGGSTSRQIDSLWVYLNEIDQSRLPEGMENKADFLLIPGERPIVFRTFLDQVGNHAIAVGYSVGVHAAFDSLKPRWVVGWTGPFLDAESTWDDRFTPLAKPAGNDPIMIQPHVPLQSGKIVFAGYSLDVDSGQPVFNYRVNNHQIADTVEPSADSTFRLTRKLQILIGDEPIWVEVANGRTITGTEQQWAVDGLLEVVTSASGRIIKADTIEHLQILVGDSASDNHRHEAIVHYNW